MIPVIERRQMRLGCEELAPLVAEEYVVALEQDERATYLYIGPLDDGHRFIAVTSESAERLCETVRLTLFCASDPRL